ncbi:transcriptional regulator Spx [Virgibacillus sediminis]|uniref:Transcriptional regulator Spx n=1 Tax=Virgibacillus sediminis TaxID=202260 RepID=A0ABV7A7I7_9BACI
MVTLFVTPSCTSCRKARKWLQANDIDFAERNILSESLTLPEIMEIFRLTDNGTEDLISTRTEWFEKNIDHLDGMHLTDLYCFIQDNPSILRSPIIHDGKRLMVGFNEFQIRRFIPKSVRTSLLHEARLLDRA